MQFLYSFLKEKFSSCLNLKFVIRFSLILDRGSNPGMLLTFWSSMAVITERTTAGLLSWRSAMVLIAPSRLLKSSHFMSRVNLLTIRSRRLPSSPANLKVNTRSTWRSNCKSTWRSHTKLFVQNTSFKYQTSNSLSCTHSKNRQSALVDSPSGPPAWKSNTRSM